MTLDQAYANDFVCIHCGNTADQMDNTLRSEFLNAVIDNLKEI